MSDLLCCKKVRIGTADHNRAVCSVPVVSDDRFMVVGSRTCIGTELGGLVTLAQVS